MVSHYQPVVTPQTPRGLKYKQFLGLLCQFELQESVIHVKHTESVRSSELVPEFLHGGNRVFSLDNGILHVSRIHVDSDFRRVPFLLGYHQV